MGLLPNRIGLLLSAECSIGGSNVKVEMHHGGL
jgi:hypothetical protein